MSLALGSGGEGSQQQLGCLWSKKPIVTTREGTFHAPARSGSQDRKDGEIQLDPSRGARRSIVMSGKVYQFKSKKGRGTDGLSLEPHWSRVKLRSVIHPSKEKKKRITDKSRKYGRDHETMGKNIVGIDGRGSGRKKLNNWGTARMCQATRSPGPDSTLGLGGHSLRTSEDQA